MDRRTFLQKLGIGVTATVVAPAAVETLLAPSQLAGTSLPAMQNGATITTAQMNAVWRKVQGDMLPAFKHLSDEWWNVMEEA